MLPCCYCNRDKWLSFHLSISSFVHCISAFHMNALSSLPSAALPPHATGLSHCACAARTPFFLPFYFPWRSIISFRSHKGLTQGCGGRVIRERHPSRRFFVACWVQSACHVTLVCCMMGKRKNGAHEIGFHCRRG